MKLEKLIQFKISKQLYDELVREAVMSGLSVSEICRLRLSNRKIVYRDQKQENIRFRPVRPVETRTNSEQI